MGRSGGACECASLSRRRRRTCEQSAGTKFHFPTLSSREEKSENVRAKWLRPALDVFFFAAQCTAIFAQSVAAPFRGTHFAILGGSWQARKVRLTSLHELAEELSFAVCLLAHRDDA